MKRSNKNQPIHGNGDGNDNSMAFAVTAVQQAATAVLLISRLLIQVSLLAGSSACSCLLCNLSQ